jgi:hypothetical protein
VGDQYLAAMNVAVICGDYYGKNIGELWASRDVKIPANMLDLARQNGLKVTVRITVRQPPNTVKIMVYDYGSDLLGSVLKNMR